LTSCISGHNTATEHTETFEKQPLKTLFLCDLCGKKDFRKRSNWLSNLFWIDHWPDGRLEIIAHTENRRRSSLWISSI